MSKMSLALLVVFMFSIFHISEWTYSYPNVPKGTVQARTYDGIETKMDNRSRSLLARKPDLIVSQGVIKDLNTSWGANEAAIKAGNKVTINEALNTLFVTIGAVTIGGASVVATVAVSVPAFITAAKTYSSAAKTDNVRLKRSVYLNAFSVALAGHEAAVALQKSEHEDYTNIYVNEYLQLMAAHGGGLYTYEGGEQAGPYTKLTLYRSIHGTLISENDGTLVFGAYVDNPNNNKESGYYHGSPTGKDHVMSTHLHWDHVDIPELPSDKACYGSSTCQVNFPTYYDAWYSHLEKCGTAINAITAAWNVATQIKYQIDTLDPNNPSFDTSLEETYPAAYKYISKGARRHRVLGYIEAVILGNRTVDEGCGRSYYNCHERHNDLHTNRDCIGNSIDDDDEANAGGTDVMHACNIHDTSVPGDHSSTWLCNESPCSNRQVPYCLAMCPETGNHGTTTDDSRVVCDIEGCQDSTPYDPDSSSAGWHAYCNECYQYKCTGGGHSWYPSCTDTTHTNANGDSCTASGYECVSHTPMYPAPTATTFYSDVWSV